MSATVAPSGTSTVPRIKPTAGDGSIFNSSLTATTGTTAALTGDLDANQGAALDAGMFQELSQYIGYWTAQLTVPPRAVMLRVQMMLQAMIQQPTVSGS